MVKKIILVWKQKYKNLPLDFWGLGDMIKGTIEVYNYCKYNNIELVVDTADHPISQFLKNVTDTGINKDDVDFFMMIDYKTHINEHKMIVEGGKYTRYNALSLNIF